MGSSAGLGQRSSRMRSNTLCVVNHFSLHIVTVKFRRSAPHICKATTHPRRPRRVSNRNSAQPSVSRQGTVYSGLRYNRGEARRGEQQLVYNKWGFTITEFVLSEEFLVTFDQDYFLFTITE